MTYTTVHTYELEQMGAVRVDLLGDSGLSMVSDERKIICGGHTLVVPPDASIEEIERRCGGIYIWGKIHYWLRQREQIGDVTPDVMAIGWNLLEKIGRIIAMDGSV